MKTEPKLPAQQQGKEIDFVDALARVMRPKAPTAEQIESLCASLERGRAQIEALRASLERGRALIESSKKLIAGRKLA